MRIQLIDNDPSLLSELTSRLQSHGIKVIQGDLPARDQLNEWRPDADLVVVGLHNHAELIAQLSRQVWPKPLAVLLPAVETAHVMQAARDGARTNPPTRPAGRRLGRISSIAGSKRHAPSSWPCHHRSHPSSP